MYMQMLNKLPDILTPQYSMSEENFSFKYHTNLLWTQGCFNISLAADWDAVLRQAHHPMKIRQGLSASHSVPQAL